MTLKVREWILPDILQPGLWVVFCGTAVGTQSACRQAYYAGPGNNFWQILSDTGLTPYRLFPKQYPMLLQFGIGLTDMAKEISGQDFQLSKSDFGVNEFKLKIQNFAPKVVGFNGKKAAQMFFGTGSVGYGLQPGKIDNTALYVLPSTSGAARAFWEPGYWYDLAKHVGEYEVMVHHRNLNGKE